MTGKLGIFDSGLGGLLITKAVRQAMPDIDILYFGDTLHVPYGNRSTDAITHYTKRAMEAMFAQGCRLIVIACNTASAAALRTLQQQWLPQAHPDKNIIGVVVPTLEEAITRGYQSIGLIATNFMIKSDVYRQELQKFNAGITWQQAATPLLVPLLENGGETWLDDVLRTYLEPFADMEALILGCTHYPALRQRAQAILGKGVDILGQDEIIPPKLQDYLACHPEYTIDQNGQTEFFVSDITDHYRAAAKTLYGQSLEIGILST